MSAATAGQAASGSRTATSHEVRDAWIERREIALLDVREEAFHAQGHPLFAANLPLSRIELEAYTRLPRRSVPIVLFDDGEGQVLTAATRLVELGYTNVSLLAGGLQAWRDAGFEIFRDVNSPSKAFGELVEAKQHTPSLSAEDVKALIEARADIVIVDARRYEEFQTMSIPTATSAPGGELVYRLQNLSERPATRVIVNCAGRTRSIIGTQALINAGLPNRVSALRNGTIGWKLAGQSLHHGARREAPPPDAAHRAQAASAARRVADAAKVGRTSLEIVAAWRNAAVRTVYRFDVRTPFEFAQGHISGFRSAPGGQLVQETDMFAPVRGAVIVLADDDGARANMTASWLAQMNWEVHVVDGLTSEDFLDNQETADELPPIPEVTDDAKITARTLHRWVQDATVGATDIALLDFSRSREYLNDHIPGSRFALRSRLEEALQATTESKAYVVTAWTTTAAAFAWQDLAAATSKPVYLLAGGTSAWQLEGYELDKSHGQFASQPVDYYQRPYEGTDASPSSMQAYLDWEFGLVEQLQRDGTHGFWVLDQNKIDLLSR
jgi:rhodanese-related sulfurtransferase